MHMCSRLNHFLKYSNLENPDTYIICIGVNDLLIPYLTSTSPLWHIQMSPRIRTMQCLINDDLFKIKYHEMIQCIISKNQNLIVIGMPYLELINFPNDKIEQRNTMIKELADKLNITYVDTNKIQKQLDDTEIKEYSWTHKNIVRVIEGIAFPVFPVLKDLFSKVRHLSFTCDGVHWNSKLAKTVSAEIQEHIK